MVHIPAFDERRTVDEPNDSPIEFCVHQKHSDEDDECPSFSVWFTMDEDVHVPIYQYASSEQTTFFSLQREYTDTDGYTEPTEMFWELLSQRIDDPSNVESEEQWNQMEVYERLFFNSLLRQYFEMGLSTEMMVVIDYAMDDTEGTTLDEYGSDDA